MTVLENIKKFYVHILSKGDPRVEKWFLMESPVPVFVIVVLYLLLVKFGPKWMDNIQPFKIKPILVIYNFTLVGISVYMFTEFLTVSLLANYSYLCQPIDFSNNPLSIRMAKVIWWYFFSKVIELLDTVFFILRKKFSQMSFLHVYHHGSMILFYWSGVKYVPGGQCFFIPMLNAFVHIFVYSYYGFAVFGAKFQKYLWWKKYLTKMQLVQFCAFVIHSGYNSIIDCDFPKGFSIAAGLYPITLIVLFSNFYYQSYLKQRKNKVE